MFFIQMNIKGMKLQRNEYFSKLNAALLHRIAFCPAYLLSAFLHHLTLKKPEVRLLLS